MHRTIFAWLSLIFFSFIVSGEARAANPCNLNPAKIMSQIKFPSTKYLTFVIAHRGLHSLATNTTEYRKTPENSRESLDNVDARCFEGAELDVRLTKDGIPVLTHDFRWGREAMVRANDGYCCFNPYGGAVEDRAGINPLVSDRTFGETKNYLLRTSYYFELGNWAETPASLEEILNHYKSKGYAFVLFLDIKGGSSGLRRAWEDVARAGMSDRVIFKFPAADFPNASQFRDFMRQTRYVNASYGDSHYIKAMPYYSTSDIAPNNAFGPSKGETKLANSLRTYMYAGIDYPFEDFAIAAEVNIKEPGAILRDVLITARNYPKMTVGIFNPSTEYVGRAGNWYYNSDGLCCSQMSNYYYNGAADGLPSDHADGREHSEFILSHVQGDWIQMVTTDNAIVVANFFQYYGYRTTSLFMGN
jgi:hypothetical protein